MRYQFTEPALRVLWFAQEEAVRIDEQYLGSEHLLLGLLREEDHTAAHVLKQLGVSRDDIRSSLERILIRGHGCQEEKIQLAMSGRQALELASEEAVLLRHDAIGTEHLLLGLIRQHIGVGARELVERGIELDQARRAVRDLQEDTK